MQGMKRTVVVATAALLCAAGVVWAAQTITATADVNGKPHPATAQIDGPSYIRCTSATGQVGDGDPPSCGITAPGFTGKVEIGKMVSAEKEGYVTLTCNGNPPLRCSAQITP
jgi:hypothetical protein